MATPNYGYEKRQRELAKKKKKEDKLRAKAERKSGEGQADAQELTGQGLPADDTAPASSVPPVLPSAG